MSLFGDVKWEEVKDNSSTPLPDGEYLVQATEAEVKETKSGDGRYLKVTYKVLDGKYKDRLYWHNFNFDNKNKIAKDIAFAELKRWFTACGIEASKIKIDKPTDVCGITCKIVLGTKEDSFGEKNVVKKWIKDTDTAHSKAASGSQKSVPGF